MEKVLEALKEGFSGGYRVRSKGEPLPLLGGQPGSSSFGWTPEYTRTASAAASACPTPSQS